VREEGLLSRHPSSSLLSTSFFYLGPRPGHVLGGQLFLHARQDGLILRPTGGGRLTGGHGRLCGGRFGRHPIDCHGCARSRASRRRRPLLVQLNLGGLGNRIEKCAHMRNKCFLRTGNEPAPTPLFLPPRPRSGWPGRGGPGWPPGGPCPGRRPPPPGRLPLRPPSPLQFGPPRPGQLLPGRRGRPPRPRPVPRRRRLQRARSPRARRPSRPRGPRPGTARPPRARPRSKPGRRPDRLQQSELGPGERLEGWWGWAWMGGWLREVCAGNLPGGRKTNDHTLPFSLLTRPPPFSLPRTRAHTRRRPLLTRPWPPQTRRPCRRRPSRPARL
jgi:hypothetical protein